MYSARYAGEQASDEENLAKLMREVPDDGDRRVAYVCALAYVEPGGREEVVHGRCEGTLAHELRGDGGFGYDPAFVPDDYDDERTMAELSADEKDAISHRGRAARALLERLAEDDRHGVRGPLSTRLTRRRAGRERTPRRRRALAHPRRRAGAARLRRSRDALARAERAHCSHA